MLEHNITTFKNTQLIKSIGYIKSLILDTNLEAHTVSCFRKNVQLLKINYALLWQISGYRAENNFYFSLVQENSNIQLVHLFHFFKYHTNPDQLLLSPHNPRPSFPFWENVATIRYMIQLIHSEIFNLKQSVYPRGFHTLTVSSKIK